MTAAVSEDVLEIVRAHRDRYDEAAQFPVEALDALRDADLLGLIVPREYGGPAGALRDVLAVGEALSREDLSVGLIYVMHCQQVAAIVAYANDKLRAELLPRIARGEIYVASVTTERSTGAHLLSSDEELAQRDGDLLWIDRDAPIVTGATHADGFLITMRAPGATPNQVSLVYAYRDQLEVKVAGDWQPLGMRASQSLPVRLVGTVPAHHVVGEHGAFRTIATAVFAPMAHLGWSACWLGTASGALARAVKHIRGDGRKQYDVSSDLILYRLARVRGRLENIGALLDHTRRVYEERPDDVTAPPVQSLLNTLKITAAEQSYAAVDELVDLLGLRHGYLRDSPLWIERALRDLRSASLNYSNDRLYLANGRLALLDGGVHLA
jgi:acyl-CoA dehydrogenase